MTVLSLFDGMSCGQIALRDMGIPIERYYASEVDKFAIKNTMFNFPETVQIGDVRNVDARSLGHIDLLIGGSPCQSFSFAGKRVGMSTVTNERVTTLDRYLKLKETGFEFIGQSYLFWEYVRILHEVREKNPNVYFMLENVEMGKQWENVIDNAIGVKGVHINSALVSAQTRRRIYWTNIRTFQADMFAVQESAIPQPKDRHIMLKDVLESEDEVPDTYRVSEKTARKILGGGKYKFTEDGFLKIKRDGRVSRNQQKADCLSVGGHGCGNHSDMDLILVQRGRGFNDGGIFEDKSPTLTSNSYEHNNFVCERTVLTPRRTEYGKAIRKQYDAHEVHESRDKIHRMEPRTDGKSNTLTTVQKDNLIVGVYRTFSDARGFRPMASNEKAPCLTARARKDGNGQPLIIVESTLRRLTPLEMQRLQTIPEWYKFCVSDSQTNKMIGNGWTVEVIKHIFSFLP